MIVKMEMIFYDDVFNVLFFLFESGFYGYSNFKILK